MEKVKLRDLGDIITGNTPSKKEASYWNSNDIPFVKPDIISDAGITILCEADEHLSEQARSKARIVNKDAVLVTCIGSIGKVGIASDGEYAFNQQINAIVPNNGIYSKYLAYAILQAKPRLEAIANAPVVPIINKSQFGEFPIYIENDLTQQKKTVEKLDKLNGIINSRKAELNKLDELIKARFVEMFGSCQTERLGDYCSTHARIGWQKLTRSEFLETGDYYLVTGWDFDVNNKVVDFSKCYYVTKERYEQDRKLMLQLGDVLLTKDGTLGKVAIVKKLDKPATLNGHIFVIRSLDGRLLPEFLAYALSSEEFKRQMEQNKTGSTIVGVTQKALLEFMLPVAPTEQQQRFADFVNQVDKAKLIVQKSLNEAQVLFDSLMQEYFS